ncbi:MAG: SUMF1/EgtB/PvdO family nonheme iron enzyme [Alphaproteobacteria bacterium]|jgi:formylglycine-generating enzyme required for sulfatase activity|nr:SUMF1/EgtB/PvdO family nonheme iron enzyme [Alphaproteobacteria bacterium]MDP6269359.1 SUMF1/EgtB/PvdO family nonheme iron enzyme [Alphaproteobacteria bacterium]MDP7426699.1 SUMF1/EgtB/PvdO family nonheme iron enzyme [Alphaproteobacteria bacterium]
MTSGVSRRGLAAALVAAAMALAPVGRTAPLPEVIAIPGGPFIIGSDRAERESAYRLDEAAYGHSITRRRGWYEAEGERRLATTAAFTITRNLITNAQYADFIAATEHAAPEVDAGTWASYGLIHPFSRSRRHAWRQRRPPPGRERHPVVLVSHFDALAYAAWLGRTTGRNWRLPSEKQWLKAARGSDGARFPWGNHFDPTRLNSADRGPFDTVAVGSFLRGASPFGLLDGAGQVFEWTATASGPKKFIVKGGSWDDKGCGVCRPAARHARPAGLKHILIGFRLVRE